MGIDRALAETCCSIIAGNHFEDGFLTEQKLKINGEVTDEIRQQNRVKHAILYSEEYYFYLLGYSGDAIVGVDRAYPVFPNFQNYAFPHDNLLDSFRTAKRLSQKRSPNTNKHDSGPGAAWQRDAKCLVTQDFYRQDVEAAHLVPKKAGTWFSLRRMIQYGRNEQFKQSSDGTLQAEDIANLISLNIEKHNNSFDNEHFAIVPKSGSWRTHVFGDNPQIFLYHNCPIQHHDYDEGYIDLDVSPEYLLVRLALTILAHNGTFFTQKRNILQCDPETSKTKARVCTPSQLEKEFPKFKQKGSGGSVMGASRQGSAHDEQMEVGPSLDPSFDYVTRWLSSEEGLCDNRREERGSPGVLTAEPGISAGVGELNPVNEEGPPSSLSETHRSIIAPKFP